MLPPRIKWKPGYPQVGSAIEGAIAESTHWLATFAHIEAGRIAPRARIPSFKGRPARTCVLPVSHILDGLITAPALFELAGPQGTKAIMPCNGQVERMNRTIKDATVKRFHYESHDQLRQHLGDFIAAYITLPVG